MGLNELSILAHRLIICISHCPLCTSAGYSFRIMWHCWVPVITLWLVLIGNGMHSWIMVSRSRSTMVVLLWLLFVVAVDGSNWQFVEQLLKSIYRSNVTVLESCQSPDRIKTTHLAYNLYHIHATTFVILSTSWCLSIEVNLDSYCWLCCWCCWWWWNFVFTR